MRGEAQRRRERLCAGALRPNEGGRESPKRPGFGGEGAEVQEAFALTPLARPITNANSDTVLIWPKYTLNLIELFLNQTNSLNRGSLPFIHTPSTTGLLHPNPTQQRKPRLKLLPNPVG